jgi:Leucine-rich repeat (LRR) protein
MNALADFTSLAKLITSLGAEATDYSALAALKNLTSLTLTPYYENPDISWLSSLTGLNSLTIKSAGKITDYSVLYGMPKLEALRLDNAKELKEIGFAANMPKLTRLAVSDSAIRSLAPLEGRIGLASLILDDNDYIDSLSEIPTLTGLQELSFISSGYGKPELPSLSKLEHLKKATISGNHIAALSGTPVTDLTITGIYLGLDCSAIAKLPLLESLYIMDSGGHELSNAGALSKLVSLRSLELRDVGLGWNYTGDTGLFRLPALEALSLYGTGGLELDTANIPVNTTLKTLKMEKCNYLMATNNGVPIYSEGGTEFLPPSYFTPLFEKLTGLEELYLPSAGLDNVDFAAKLENLRVLDISDSYVTDISPLAGLEKLEALYCAKTPVSNLQLLADVAVVR